MIENLLYIIVGVMFLGTIYLFYKRFQAKAFAKNKAIMDGMTEACQYDNQ